MKVAFRVDASLQIGSGHVMRCLTLAAALRDRGALCHFICRAHEGHLAEAIRQRGFDCHLLPAPSKSAAGATVRRMPDEPHARWLGGAWEEDADQSMALLAGLDSAWLVVDHYAIGRDWEARLRTSARHLLVIDDLADRPHDCDLLLDQNLGREPGHYADLVPTGCELAIGPEFALLRPDFAIWRQRSLQRREPMRLRSLLISMGGVDPANATGAALLALRECKLEPDCTITVVMGAQAPWLEQVRAIAAAMPWPTDVLVNAGDMARLMADHDFGIGAAGSTAWERCCLGMPSALVVLADNQRLVAESLAAAGACWLVGEVADIPTRLPAILHEADAVRLAAQSRRAAMIADGRGVARLIEKMTHVDARA